MQLRPLGNTGLELSPIGFGAFKIGRNTGIKYPNGYELPSLVEVEKLLNGVLDLGVNYIDTAPAYGLSEQRIGEAISHRRDEFVLSTKVGETFKDGESTYDFTSQAVHDSVHASLRKLGTDVLDIVFIHSNGDDLEIINETDAVDTLQSLRDEGKIKVIGLSGKTAEGAAAALKWAGAIMVEYHVNDTSHDAVMREAKQAGVGVVVKKGLASGHLPAEQAIPFVLKHDAVASLVIGGLSIDHFRANVALCRE